MPAAAPEIVRFAGLPRERWRNGGGSTVEILRSSTTAEATAASGAPAAVGQDWLYRISVADIDKEGEFSAFPGCERVLTLVDGEFLLLAVDGVEQGLQKYRPFRFDGGAPTLASPSEGPVRVLNVVTAPGARGHVVILELSKKRPHPVSAGQFAVLLQGQASVAPAGTSGSTEAEGAGPVPLERYDTVVGSEEAPPEVSGRGFLAIVSVDEA
jgi:uncharacterized protein